jgi:BASS family bile acid:Na+ symporter
VNIARLIPTLNVAALIAIMLSMGMAVKLEAVWAAARSVRLLALCLLANYVLVPIVTLALLYAFQASPFVSVGFFILAVCPGAPIGPPIAALRHRYGEYR